LAHRLLPNHWSGDTDRSSKRVHWVIYRGPERLPKKSDRRYPVLFADRPEAFPCGYLAGEVPQLVEVIGLLHALQPEREGPAVYLLQEQRRLIPSYNLKLQSAVGQKERLVWIDDRAGVHPLSRK
jgi:hypothetical protein